ncbi:hypothetical protein PN36_08200 [Candidatus Thiomargarita nelsonii]|uniref:Uncharacterized protein n=1 Tax=Candidatus Thiomargarita nelsonii TaxID=1003181 RepID=A0A4E0RK14_9GAMM|nr:hypothetical protein PN36_08200 [Candidatus Thiomargarita nelsonii]
MNKPQLIAETPRAGKWNHRFIAAQDCSLSDSEIKKIVAAARRNPQGDDYLAVSVKTAQSVSGRTGNEILVLVGVDVKKLSETQRQQIVTQLEQRLADLATLVTEINWDRDGQAILVKRRELGEWEKWFGEFVPEQDKKVAVPKKPSSGQLKWVAGLVVGILLVLAIWAIIQMSEESAPRQNHSETESSNLKDKNPQKTPDAEAATSETGNKSLEHKQDEASTTEEEPYRKLERSLCEKFNWCGNALALPESDPEKIEQVLSDLDTKDVWSFLLSFVDNSQGSPQAYLGELADFDKSDFNQIIAQQRKLRQVFLDFKNVATQVSFDTPPNSEEYPVLSFVYQVSNKFPEMPEKTTLQDENKLPFFRNNDVARAKFLKSVVEDGRSNKLIDDGKHVKVFDALCQLSDEKTVNALYDQENRLEKLCIVPDKEYPTQRQCERLNTEEKKKQAKAFLELRNKLKRQLGC